MIELKKYQCEHCDTVYDKYEAAQKCESNHILLSELQIVKAMHPRCPSVVLDVGQWPSVIIIGKDNVADVLARYEYKGPEDWATLNDPIWGGK